eukprot:m.31807 g.31807  ORF g.31807 m.31807 type:complete len:72 (+) comp14042_c0_seq2:471-686(+)
MFVTLCKFRSRGMLCDFQGTVLFAAQKTVQSNESQSKRSKRLDARNEEAAKLESQRQFLDRFSTGSGILVT